MLLCVVCTDTADMHTAMARVSDPRNFATPHTRLLISP